MFPPDEVSQSVTLDSTKEHGTEENQRRWRYRLAAVLVSMLASILIAEICLRWVSVNKSQQATQGRHSVCRYDPILGWSAIANSRARLKSSEFDVEIRINSQGIRSDIEYAQERVPNKARIVVVGDSFTFGHGVENSETYCRLLEKDLRRTEVINLGMSAYGTDQQLLRLRDEGLQYHPDLVILGLYIGDVFRNNQSQHGAYCKPFFVIRDEQLVLSNMPVPRNVPTRSFPTRMLNRSRLYDLLSSRLVWLAQHHGYGSSWQVTEKIVETMNTEVNAAGAELLVVVIAAETGIYGRGLGRSTHIAAMEHLVNLLERTGVEYVNSTERFAKVASQGQRRLYYAQDGHFTRDGHALLARLIQEHIEAKGW